MNKINSGILRLQDNIDYQQDAVVSKEIIKGKTGNVTLFSFYQGQGLSEHRVSFKVLVNILEGEAKIFIEDKAFLLKRGDSIILPADKPHRVQAVENFKMMLIMIKS
jgi:quercetin dioxygenase-like cupin family protein